MVKKLLLTCIALMLLFPFKQLMAQMVGTNAYIKATSVEIGIAGAGGFEGAPTGASPPLPGMHFRSGNPFFGFVSNPQVNAWASFDGDFFTPGSPENGWGVEIGTAGTSYGNNCSYLNQISGSITGWSHIFNCYSADWEGDLTTGTNLHFKINYFLQETDLYYTTTISITNNTGATIPDLYYYRNVDPDNNQPISGDFTTQNTIVSQPFSGACNTAHVKATSNLPASQPQSYLGFAAVGANWRAGYGGFANRDASNMWTGAGFVQTVGSTAFADQAMFIAYRIQNLAPGATETFKFVVILDDLAATNAINNSLFLSYPGSSTAPPAVCTPYSDTVKICQGVPATISVSGPTTASYNWNWSPATGLSPSTGTTVSANPASTTTYTVTGTPISSCFAPVSLTFVVQVKPSPTVTVPPNITTCAGGTVPATAFTSVPAGATYTWTNSNPAIGIAASGSGNIPGFIATNSSGAPITGTITVTPTIAGNPCPGIASSYTITVNPNPVISVNSATICPGQTATLTAAGGTTYLWNTGSTANPLNVSPVTTTTYTVTGTTAGCSGTAVATVTIGGSVAVTVNSPTICAGQTATLTAAGATTYSWSNGASGNPITVSPATTTSYTVTGTSSGCTGTAVSTVTVNPVPTMSAPANIVVCHGAPVAASAFSSLPAGATFSWTNTNTSIGLAASGAGNTPAFTAVNAGTTPVSSTITVTPTLSGCTGAPVSYTITVNPIPVITVNSQNICPTQTATLTAAGGTTYVWSTGATTNPISVTPASTTSYTVTGTTAGCSSTAVATVTVGGSITVTVNSETICNGQTATLTASGGTTYSWSTGSTANPLTVSPATTTSYTVTGSAAGCTGTAVATVTVDPLPTAVVPANITVCNNGGVAGTGFSSVPAGATFTWTNSNPSIGIPASGAGDIAFFTALNAGSTPVTATIAVTPVRGGCTGPASTYTITVNPTPTVSVPANISVCNGSTVPASAFVSSPAGGTFSWTNSDPSIGLAASGSGNVPSFTGVNAGTTDVTATITVTPTVNGCPGTPNTYTITIFATPAAPIAPGVSICANTSATLNASGPAVGFDWYTAPSGGAFLGTSPTYVTPNLSTSTNYYVQAIDAAGCISPMTTVPVTIASGLSVFTSSDDTVCYGGSTTLSAIPGGAGYTYSWSPAASLSNAAIENPIASPAATTTYTVQVTDAGGCTGSATVTVYANTQINMAIAGIDVTCNSACNGQTIVIPNGGAGGYSYLWNTGCTGASCSGLCPGTYTVTVTDAWGCTAIADTTITEPTPVTAAITASQAASCNGACDGSATAAGAGGTPGYTYSWNTVPVQATATATGLCEGSYTCTITDANGCTNTAVATISAPTVVVIAPIAPATVCSGGSTTLTASASGGTAGGYNYVWSPAGTGSGASVTVTPAATTVYTVNATDVNGCPAAAVNVTVTVNPPLSATSGGSASICPGASATLSAAGANGNGGPYTYSWSPTTGLSNPNIANPVASPGSTTVYTVTVTDGCSPAVTSTETITVLPLPAVSFNSATTSGCSPVCVVLNNTSTVAGGGIATWSWDYGDGSPADTAHAHCYTTPGSYTVGLTVTSTNGCVASSSITNYITVYPDPVAGFMVPSSVSIVNPTVSFANTSTGATTMIWDFGDSFNPLTNSSGAINPSHTYAEVGTYCITLTAISANGCTDTAEVCIDVAPEFTFFIPNAFSPNSDGLNDFFSGKGDYIKEYEMFIYDRWGNMIYFTDELSKPWDGRANHGDEIAQVDTYVYVIKVKDGQDKLHKYIGSVTIVK